MNVYKTTTLLVSCQMEFQAAGGKNYTINTHLTANCFEHLSHEGLWTIQSNGLKFFNFPRSAAQQK